MPDELTVGELGRTVDALRHEFRDGMAGINARLDRLVSTEVYALQKQHTDQRLDAMARELQKARDDLKTLEDTMEANQLSEMRRRERDRQVRLYQMVVPILICVVSGVIAIWAVVAK